jgi:RNA polymerase sigma factor (sigma-70 family)
MDDRRLASFVAAGDETAFEAIYHRHHSSLLAFCRHFLGDRQDAEDVLQQTFLRAHRALDAGRLPDSVRPWLFTIARNRCLTLLAARRDTVAPPEALEPACDGLNDDVRRRADLSELIADLGGLPTDQRDAIVLFVMGGLRHADVASEIGCAPAKVKALVFQAREAMSAERAARDAPCERIRALVDSGSGGVLRRAPLRRHLRQCAPCRSYRGAGRASQGV